MKKGELLVIIGLLVIGIVCGVGAAAWNYDEKANMNFSLNGAADTEKIKYMADSKIMEGQNEMILPQYGTTDYLKLRTTTTGMVNKYREMIDESN